jgi:hypothetical protein
MHRSFVRLLQVLIAAASLTPGLALAWNALDDNFFYVQTIYWDLLNRAPTHDELYGGFDYLEACGSDTSCQRARQLYMARSVFDSPEHYNAQGLIPGHPQFQEAYVWRCYTGFLKRQPESAGFNFWLPYLQNTNDYGGVINGFLNSTEYRGHFGDP